jgi:hypothetical protein
MNWTGIFNAFGRLCQSFFIGVVEKLGNSPNLLYIITGVVVFLIWMSMMARYNKEADRNGTLR